MAKLRKGRCYTNTGKRTKMQYCKPGRKSRLGTLGAAAKTGGCRDAQGEFVPVPQCNPAQYAGRKPKTPRKKATRKRKR